MIGVESLFSRCDPLGPHQPPLRCPLTLWLTRHQAVLPVIEQLLSGLGGHMPVLGPCFLFLVYSFLIPPQVSFCYLFPQLFCRQPPSSTVCTGCRPPQGTSRAMHPDISLQQHRSVPRSRVDWVREVKYHSHAFRNPTSSLRFLTRGQYRHFPV